MCRGRDHLPGFTLAEKRYCMSGSVGSVGPVVNTAVYGTTAAATTPVAATASPPAPAAANKDTSGSRFLVDPLAGPITQFLNVSGDVQDQIPSKTVVAYLKAGLTVNGLSKSDKSVPGTIA